MAAIGPAAAASIDVGAATPGAAPTPAADPAPFVHLHVHSNFSFLDGGSRIEELVARAAALGQPALALTDHDGLYGAIRFAKTCTKHKIKPLFGAEIRVESLLHAEPPQGPGAPHGTAPAQNGSSCGDVPENAYAKTPLLLRTNSCTKERTSTIAALAQTTTPLLDPGAPDDPPTIPTTWCCWPRAARAMPTCAA